MSFRALYCSLLVSVFAVAAYANPALEGYSNYESLQQRLSKLAGRERVQVSSLGQTRGKREIFLVTVGTKEFDQKPGVLIVGDVAPSEMAGSELVVRMIEQLLDRASKDEAVAKMLERRTFYFIPRPSPDTHEKSFAKPFREPAGNATPTDDDRDGKQGEDPPDDLNDDGWITMLRVEDVGGEYITHPDDPRVMIKAELAKQERGKFKLLIEGRDNDGDEQLNEDAGDGVSFNRNFTFQYPAFKAQSGPNAVSETETRAVADFCFDHPNISAVWTMTPEDNLLHPWKADANKDRAKIRTTILSDDAKYQDILASQFQKLRDAKGPPGSPDGEGSFSEWAYFHYGRGSVATRPWWIPPVEPKEGEKKPEDKRGADDLNALRYFAANNLEGFVDWKPIEHPDFPGRKVEVGGFKPFYRHHPPIAELDGIATKFTDFLVQAEAVSTKLSLTKLKAEALGGGVVRLSVTIVNEGLFPTHPEMGEVSQQAYPLQLVWSVPEKSTWLQGSARSRVGRIAGNGGFVEKVSLVRIPEPLPKELKLRVYAPAVGSVEGSVEVK